MATPQFPDISVPWDVLEDAASDMASRAAVTQGYLADAVAAWRGLETTYRESDTEEKVHSALHDVQQPLQDWERSLREASNAVSDFVAAGRSLEQRVQELMRAENRRAPESDDAADDAAEEHLAEQAAAFTREWTDLQESAAAAIGSIAYGDGTGLPMAEAVGGAVLPEAGWAALTSQLDDRFGTPHPDRLLESLKGLNEEERREWADANPEAAALLAARGLTGRFPAGTPEHIMQGAMADGADLTRDGVKGIQEAWTSLSLDDQERLLLLYPAVFGNLNGVPFAQRAQANVITLAGHRSATQTLLDGLREPMADDYGADYVSQQQWVADMNAYDAEKARLNNLLRGLNHAYQENTQVVMLGTEGNGQVVTMVGTPSPDTRIVATLVPGSGANLGELASYSEKFTNIYRNEEDHKLGFYWQGSDFPQDALWDNIDSDLNELGGPRLAGFDFAVDLEVPSDARSTYLGYSAGGSMMGTGEREGLDSTNIVYVAPAGPGHEVAGPGNTANPDANRYWIQTRDDSLIESAQLSGGEAHGWWHSGRTMDVNRLESGFSNPRDPESLMHGHMDYFHRGSTAASNMNGVIEGTTVSPFVEYIERWDNGHSWQESPLEDHPGNYTGDKLKAVPVKNLEE